MSEEVKRSPAVLDISDAARGRLTAALLGVFREHAPLIREIEIVHMDAVRYPASDSLRLSIMAIGRVGPPPEEP